MFKKGDKVICVDNADGNLYLKIDKEYNVININPDGFISVINDFNSKCGYLPMRFELAKRKRSNSKNYV